MSLNPMAMKIQSDELGDGLRLKLEGRLAGAWVSELEQCWHTASAVHPDRNISVDLSGLTCVDQAGQYLLRLMRRDGVNFVGAGLAVREFLEK